MNGGDGSTTIVVMVGIGGGGRARTVDAMVTCGGAESIGGGGSMGGGGNSMGGGGSSMVRLALERRMKKRRVTML
jgi:hypothetical protein